LFYSQGYVETVHTVEKFRRILQRKESPCSDLILNDYFSFIVKIIVFGDNIIPGQKFLHMSVLSTFASIIRFKIFVVATTGILEYIHTYIHTYTHTYMHTYIHTYIHTRNF
jgi:hypothetical protein